MPQGTLFIPCLFANRQVLDQVMIIIQDWSKQWQGARKYGWVLKSKDHVRFFFSCSEEPTPFQVSELYAKLLEVPGLGFINTEFF